MRFADVLRFSGIFVVAALLGSPPALAGGDQVYAFQGGYSGIEPLSALLAVGGRLYGTTAQGGDVSPATCTFGCGTVFWIDPKTRQKRVVYTFKGGSDGVGPEAGLINVGGILYGTTESGGTAGVGTVFAFNPATNTENNLHSFLGGNDGTLPASRLLNVHGTLYGTTSYGGSFAGGIVFSLNLASGVEKVVYTFKKKPDGANSYADLIDVEGMLYGTTARGGSSNRGTIFSLDPATGAESVLHSFAAHNDGSNPQAGLINVEGALFGADAGGGAGNQTGFGAITSLDLATRTEKIVYSFSSTDGFIPSSDLINVGGTLYGTTQGGGSTNDGVVFSLNLITRIESTVYSFQGGSDGDNPYASVIDVDGILYGTTERGGSSSGDGTVFAVAP